MTEPKAILETRNWVKQVVIDQQFCPFALKPYLENKIRYVCISDIDLETILQTFLNEVIFLEEHPEIDTSLLVLDIPHYSFETYLELVELSEILLEEQGFEGIYQLASFHPDYQFEGTDETDPSNYTNRSPHPILHILREELLDLNGVDLSWADEIPERNIQHCHKKGMLFMKALLDSCYIK